MTEPIDIFNVEPHVAADAVADSLHGEHTGYARKALTGYITHALAKHRYTEVMTILHNADTEPVWPFVLLGALVKPTRHERRSLYDTLEEQGITREDLSQIWQTVVESATYVTSIPTHQGEDEDAVTRWTIRIVLRNGDRYIGTFDSDTVANISGGVLTGATLTHFDLQMDTLVSTNALGRLITLTSNIFIRSIYPMYDINMPGVDNIQVRSNSEALGNMLNCMVAVESNHLQALIDG